MSILAELRACASAWEPQARLLGNVRADEIVALCDELEAARAKLAKVKRDWEAIAAFGETLSLCSPAERKVLDAMAALDQQALLNMISDDYYNPEYCVAIAQAELDRRAEEEP